MKKKVLAVLLTLSMTAGLLAGCGQQENVGEGSSGEAATQENEAEGTAQGSGEITEITVKFVNSGGNTTESDRILAKVNEITEAEIGIHVNAEWIDIGNWSQQVGMMLSSGEEIDIMSLTPLLQISALNQQNQLMDISGYLKEYAQETLELVDPIIEAVSDGEAIYGVPRIMPFRGTYGVCMNEDILDELGLTEKARAMTTWTELEEILVAVHEAYPDIAPMYVSPTNNCGIAVPGYDFRSDNFSENKVLDVLGDNYNLVYENPDTGEVESYYDSECFEAVIERATDWYKKGLINLDGVNAQEDGSTALANGICFAVLNGSTGSPENIEAQGEARTGVNQVYVPICDSPTSTFIAGMFGYAVPYTSKNPEAAVQFINYVMNSSELQSLLSWGEEGIDYVVTDGIASYPEGKDMSSVGYHTQNYIYGNSFLSYPWEGTFTPEELKEEQEAMSTLEPTTFFGLLVDTTSVTNEITACYNAVQEFATGLQVGSTQDYDGDLQKLREKINASGIDKVVECYKTAAEEFLNNK